LPHEAQQRNREKSILAGFFKDIIGNQPKNDSFSDRKKVAARIWYVSKHYGAFMATLRKR